MKHFWKNEDLIRFFLKLAIGFVVFTQIYQLTTICNTNDLIDSIVFKSTLFEPPVRIENNIIYFNILCNKVLNVWIIKEVLIAKNFVSCSYLK